MKDRDYMATTPVHLVLRQEESRISFLHVPTANTTEAFDLEAEVLRSTLLSSLHGVLVGARGKETRLPRTTLAGVRLSLNSREYRVLDLVDLFLARGSTGYGFDETLSFTIVRCICETASREEES